MSDRTAIKSNVILLLLTALVSSTLIIGFNQMLAPIASAQQNIKLSIEYLPICSLRTTMRLTLAILASVLISIIYATLAAKNKRIGKFLIPLLNIFQSVPVLGYISFTVTGFLALFPGNIFGIEIAIIFAIFTAQVWNMIFSVYQSLISVPKDLYGVSQIYQLNKWQIFWKVELPFAVPGLVYNSVISMSSSWFFIVVSELITAGTQTFTLPGIGVYISTALKNEDINSILHSLIAILFVITIFNQLVFAPLVAWSYKFRYEFNTGSNFTSSWLYECFKHATIFDKIFIPLRKLSTYIIQLKVPKKVNDHLVKIGIFLEILWWIAIIWLITFLAKELYTLCKPEFSKAELFHITILGTMTALRVIGIVIIASLIWVPIGVYIGSRAKLSARIQPFAQFLTALPANIYFPIFVIGILHFKLNPEIWLAIMMGIGAQWYILFNVIAGAQSIPTELTEAADNFNLHGLSRWKKLIIPGIAPYYITGAITASGGAWNASIVSEVVHWGSSKVSATGLGAYIVQNTSSGDNAKIAMGVIVMSLYVELINKIFWQRVLKYVSEKTRLE